MNKEKKRLFLCLDLLILILGCVLDQASKYWAVTALKGKEAIELIPGVLELRYLENRGAAFGMLQGGKPFFLIITPIILIGIVYVLLRMPAVGKYRILHLLLSCVAVGAVGNLIDRVRLEYVVDFIYISLIDFPIFNVADMFVSIACVAGVCLILFGKEYKDGDFAFLNPSWKPQEEGEGTEEKK